MGECGCSNHQCTVYRVGVDEITRLLEILARGCWHIQQESGQSRALKDLV